MMNDNKSLDFYTHWDVYRTENYAIRIYVDIDSLDELDDNVDVEVEFKGGERYAATFFTPENIRTLMEKWSATPEYFCKQGLYFWCVDMVIVSILTVDVIIETVEDLLQQGEFEKAFQRLEPVTLDEDETE